MANEELRTGFPSIDKPWLKYYTEEDLALETPQCTVYQNVFEHNRDHLDDVAISYYGNEICYGTLFTNTEACAKALRQIGIQPGDCVTLCTAAVPEAVYLVLACSRIGAIANFLNPMFSVEQMVDRINDTEGEWAFVLDAMYSFISEALPRTCIRNVVIIPATNSVPPLLSKLLYLKSEARKIVSKGNGSQKFIRWSEFYALSREFEGDPDVSYQPDTPAVMVYSSGSTGASKGILLTNDGINATIENYITSGFTLDRKDTFLQMIPIWFSTGIIMSMLMPMTYGITIIPEPKFSKESFVADLVKYKPSVTLTATSLWLYAIDAEEMRDADLSNMKYAITGGEKVLPRDEERVNAYLRKHGCTRKFYKGYGMCELGSTISGTTDNPDCPDKPGSCGYPILNATVSAFDVFTGKELPCGQHGELRVLSPARMKGYYKNPEATAEFFGEDENGDVWARTGDVGYVDGDGEVFVLGRATDCCQAENGETVFLFDIEEEILKDENVGQCKVVDFNDGGSLRLAAHIVLCGDEVDSTMVLRRIERRVFEVLPEHMQPDYYKTRKSMPVHNNGKRDVEALRRDREELFHRSELS